MSDKQNELGNELAARVIDFINSWTPYVSDYFAEKWGLKRDIEEILDLLNQLGFGETDETK